MVSPAPVVRMTSPLTFIAISQYIFVITHAYFKKHHQCKELGAGRNFSRRCSQRRRNGGAWQGHCRCPLKGEATGAQVPLHNSIIGNFVVYQDPLETNLLQLFAQAENSEWFSTISPSLLCFAIAFEVNIVSEHVNAERMTIVCALLQWTQANSFEFLVRQNITTMETTFALKRSLYFIQPVMKVLTACDSLTMRPSMWSLKVSTPILNRNLFLW